MRHPLTLLLLLLAAVAQAQIDIWDGVKGKPRVELTPYVAPEGSGVAVVVCPGGSYFWHDMKTEGDGVARWLQSQGITAFVLKYRTAQFPAYFTHYRLLFRGVRYPDAQDDLRQALSYIRTHAAAYGVDTTRLGAMGFSAGGHLVMSAAELFPVEERPKFVAPIYPVVTMRPPYVHKRSRRALLGDSRTGNRQLRDSLSLELHVPTDCPPVFLVNCKDDPVVQYQNSLLLDSALTARAVSHVYLQYQTGGHGFGASDVKGSEECRQWRAAFLAWLRRMFPDTNLSNNDTEIIRMEKGLKALNNIARGLPRVKAYERTAGCKSATNSHPVYVADLQPAPLHVTPNPGQAPGYVVPPLQGGRQTLSPLFKTANT